MANLRIALVGCGFMGRMHASVYATLEGAEVVALVDKSPGNAAKLDAKLPVYPSLDKLFEGQEVDVLDICLPTDLHAEFTLQAAYAGKHVFCEKPMALRLSDADKMRSVCEAEGVRLMIGHCIRFWPEYAYLKRLIDDRSLGGLLSLSLLRYGAFPSWSSDNWLADESRAGGGAMDMHIHDTDFALYALGKPLSVSSFGTRDKRGVSQIFTTMTYPGAVVHLEGGWNLPAATPFKHAYRAIFKRGAAIMDAGPLTIYEDGKEPVMPEFPKMEAAGGGNISDLGGYYFELKDFVEKLQSGEPFVVSTPETSIDSLEMALREIELVGHP